MNPWAYGRGLTYVSLQIWLTCLGKVVNVLITTTYGQFNLTIYS